jgi:hypothetical protein
VKSKAFLRGEIPRRWRKVCVEELSEVRDMLKRYGTQPTVGGISQAQINHDKRISRILTDIASFRTFNSQLRNLGTTIRCTEIRRMHP